jgi:CubicO group peptidase (beta-lactamase class C family)
MTHADAATHWTARLTDLATATRVPGAVLGILADGHQTIAAHGVLSNATGVPVTGDAVFQIGSITKPWTGTMIMQLVDEGKLSLDTTVADVLPGIKLGGPLAVVTEAEPEEFDLLPADSSGDNFVGRSRVGEPWRR